MGTSQTSKRPLSTTLSEPTSPHNTRSANKRPRTSVASGIPGIADVPTSPSARATFFNITSGLVAAGAKPVEQMEQQLKEHDRNEAMDIMMGQDAVSDDDDDEDEEGEVLQQLVSPVKPTPIASAKSQEDDTAMDVDGEPVTTEGHKSKDDAEGSTSAAAGNGDGEAQAEGEGAAGVGPDGEPVDERVAFPSRYLATSWRTITKLHTPRYELSTSRSLNPQTYGCTLHLHFPPSSTRSYTVPSTFPTKRAAKDAASSTALKAGAVEKGLEARKAAGEEVWEGGRAKGVEGVVEQGGDPWDTVDNPCGLLHQGFQRFMPVGKFEWEWETDNTTNLHAPTLHIPITPQLTKHYSLPCTFTSRREAKDTLARVALRDGILTLYENAFKARLEVDSGGYLSFAGVAAGGKKEGTRDAIAALNKEVTDAFGGVKGMKWEFSSVEQGPDVQEEKKRAEANPGLTPAPSAPLLLYGVTLLLTLHPPSPSAPHPSGIISFTVPPVHHTRQHARQACAALALKEGLVDEVREAKRQFGALAGRGGGRREKEEGKGDGKGQEEIPKAGSVSKEGLKGLTNATAYLNLCFQQWTGTTAPLTFEYQVDEEANKYGCTLTILPSAFLPLKNYTTPPTHSSKKFAKEAVAQLAFEDGVLDVIKPKEGQVARGAQAQRGGATRGRGAIRGGGAMGGRGGFAGGAQNGFGGQAPQRNGPSPQLNGQSNGYGNGNGYSNTHNGWPQAPPPHLQQQQQRPHPQQQQQGYYPSAPPTPQQQQQYNQQLFAPTSQPGGGQDMVAYFDDFCRSWMGPGAPLPAYDVRQDPQSGLFGAVVRLALFPDGRNTKAYWVDYDFHTRADAQEAVARIAVMDGVVEQVRREVGQYVAPPQQQLQQRGGAGCGPGPLQQGPMGGRGPPPHQQNQQQQQQGPPPPRPNGRQPLPPQGSPAVRPPPMQQNRPQKPAHPPAAPLAVVNKPAPPPPVVNKSALPPPVAVKEALKPAAAAALTNDDEGGQFKKPNSVSLLNSTYQVLFGDKPERRPVYVVSPEDGSGRFSASIRIAITPSTVLYFATPTIHTSKREAKEAVATLAIGEGKAVEQMKAIAATEWQSSLIPTAAAPVAPAPPPKQQAAAPSVGKGGSASVAHYGGRGVGSGGAALVPEQVSGVSTASSSLKQKEMVKEKETEQRVEKASSQVETTTKASSRPPRTPSQSTAPVASGPSSSIRPAVAATQLIDFCANNAYPPPEFGSEPGTATISEDGSTTTTTGVRVWCIVGELRFELPNPRAVEEGQEKLAGRVLKHLTAEVQKKKQAA